MKFLVYTLIVCWLTWPHAISNKLLFALRLKIMNLSDFINSKAKYLRRSHTIWWFKDFKKKCSKQALEIKKKLDYFFQNDIVMLLLLFFKNNWMPKFNRSLSTTKLVREIFYITFECFPSWFWMTERTLICYRCHWPHQCVSQEHDLLYGNKRVFGPGSLIENDFI